MNNKIEYIAYKRGYRVDENGIMYNPRGLEIAKNRGTMRPY